MASSESGNRPREGPSHSENEWEGSILRALLCHQSENEVSLFVFVWWQSLNFLSGLDDCLSREHDTPDFLL